MLCLFCTGVSANDTIMLTATFQAGTCDVSVPPALDLGEVDVTPILNQQWLATGKTPLTLALTDCYATGLPEDGQVPTITMSGDYKEEDIVSASQGLILQDPSSTTKMFGISLFKTEAGVDASDTQDILKVTSMAGGTNAGYLGLDDIPDNGDQVTLFAAVTCGNTSNCATTNPRAKAGTVSATATFNFEYH